MFLILIYIFRQITPCNISKFWVTTFIGIWGVTLSISASNPEDLNNIRAEIYILFILFVFSYSAGFSLKKVNSFENENFIARHHLISKLIKKKIVIAIIFFIFIALLYYNAYYYQNIFALEDITSARESRYAIGAIFKSGIELFAFNYLIAIPTMFIKFLLVYMVITKIKNNTVTLLTLTISILWGSFGAGRNVAIEIFIFGLLVQKIENQSKITSANNNATIIIGSISLILFSIMATAFRSFQASDLNMENIQNSIQILANHFLVYTTGSIRAFQYAYDNDSLYLFPSYGLLTLAGIHEIISYPLIAIGFDIIPYTWKYGDILRHPIPIGQTTEFNALYTTLYNFYFDFGIIGAIAIPFIFGYFCNLSLRKFLKKPNIFYLAGTAVFFLSSMWSILTWTLASPQTIVLLIILYITGHLFEKKFFRS